jgi:hypothetical protein
MKAVLLWTQINPAQAVGMKLKMDYAFSTGKEAASGKIFTTVIRMPLLCWVPPTPLECRIQIE